MSLFLIDKNNLGDVDDVFKARSNLGIEFLFNPRFVDIQGGSIKIDSFCLNTPDDPPPYEDGRFLRSDSNGCARWEQVDLPTQEQLSQLAYMNEWLSNASFDLSNITNVSSLTNDAGYITESFANQQFLNVQHNLSDLQNVSEAISNLGLSHVHDSNVRVNDISVDGDIMMNRAVDTIPIHNVLSLDKNSKKVTLNRIADNQIEILDSNANIVNSHSRPPSVYVLKQIYQNLNSRLTALDSDVNNIVIGANVLQSLNNLADVENVETARTNLGLDGWTSNESGGIRINDFSTNRFTFDHSSAQQSRILTCVDNQGTASWQDLPPATQSTLGMVKISEDVTISATSGDKVVPSLHSVQQLNSNIEVDFSTIRNEYLKISNKFQEFADILPEDRTTLINNLGISKNNIGDFPLNLSEYVNDEAFLKRDNFLNELALDLQSTRQNLGLKTVSWTGDFQDLSNIPNFLRNTQDIDFSSYAVRNSNLADIDPVIARQNLGLGDIVLMNTSNVFFTGGTLTNMTSIATNEFVFPFESTGPSYDTLSNIIFLKADNPFGHATWGTLPFASLRQHGILKLIDDILDYDSHSDDGTYSSTIINQKFQNLQNDVDDIEQTLDDMQINFTTSNLSVSDIVTSNLQARQDIVTSNLTVHDTFNGNMVNASNLNVADEFSTSNILSDSIQTNSISTNSIDVADTIRTSNLDVTGDLTASGAVRFTGDVTFDNDPITRTALVDTVTLLTDSMVVDTTIKYLHGMSNEEVHIYKNSIMHTDEHGNLRWGERMRIHDSVPEKQAGITLVPSEHTSTGLRTELNMQVYSSNGMLFFSKETGLNTNEYEIKHIFR